MQMGTLALAGLMLVLQQTPVPAGGDADRVLAEMEGYRLTQGDFEQLIELLGPAQRTSLGQPEEKEKFIRQWMQTLALERAGQERQLDQGDEFRSRLKIQRMQLLADLFLERVGAEVKIEEEELESYYQANKESLRHPVSVELRRILLGDAQTAGEIARRAHEGEDFAELAQSHSKDLRTNTNGGYVGWVVPLQLEPSLDQAVFAMEPGQILGPVRSVQGWFVLKALDKKPAGYYSLSEVRFNLVAKLLEEKVQKARQEAVNQVLERYQVKLHLPQG